MASTGLTRARRFQAALALDLIPASKVQSDQRQFAELDKHNKAINPVSKTDWEGTGVEPDVKVAAADALKTAEKIAAEKIQAERKKQ
jgi:hypothetical protein